MLRRRTPVVSRMCFRELPALREVDGQVNPNPLCDRGWRSARFLWRIAGVGPNEMSEIDFNDCDISTEEYAVLVRSLSHVPILRLWLAENPGPRQLRSYRLCTIDALPSLEALDGMHVSANERVNARRQMAEMRTEAMALLTRPMTDVDGACAAWGAAALSGGAVGSSSPSQQQQEEEEITSPPSIAVNGGGGGGDDDFDIISSSSSQPSSPSSELKHPQLMHQKRVPLHLVASEALQEEFIAMEADVEDAGWALMQNARGFLLYEEASIDAVSGRLSAKFEQLINFIQFYALVIGLDVTWPPLWAHLNGRQDDDSSFSWSRILFYELPMLDVFRDGSSDASREDSVSSWRIIAYVAAMGTLPLLFVLYRYPRASHEQQRPPPSNSTPSSSGRLHELSPGAESDAAIDDRRSPLQLTPAATGTRATTSNVSCCSSLKSLCERWFGYTPVQLRKRIVLFAVTALYMPLSRCALQPFSPQSPYGPIVNDTTGGVRMVALWPTLFSVVFVPVATLGVPLLFVVLVRKATDEAERAFNYAQMETELNNLQSFLARMPGMHDMVPAFAPTPRGSAETELTTIDVVPGGIEDNSGSDDSVISQLDGRRIMDEEAAVQHKHNASMTELLHALGERRTALRMLYAKAVREYVTPYQYLYQDYRREWKYYKSFVMTLKLVLLVMATNVVRSTKGQGGTTPVIACTFAACVCLLGTATALRGHPFESSSEHMSECVYTFANAINSVAALALAVHSLITRNEPVAGGVVLTAILVCTNVGALLFAAGCASVTPILRVCAKRRNEKIRAAVARAQASASP